MAIILFFVEQNTTELWKWHLFWHFFPAKKVLSKIEGHSKEKFSIHFKSNYGKVPVFLRSSKKIHFSKVVKTHLMRPSISTWLKYFLNEKLTQYHITHIKIFNINNLNIMIWKLKHNLTFLRIFFSFYFFMIAYHIKQINFVTIFIFASSHFLWSIR